MTNLNKFPDGPWTLEPDFHKFDHNGFTCVIKRARQGHLCGHVKTRYNAPWADYINVLEVHGGVEIQDNVLEGVEAIEESETWFGFSASHAHDQLPLDVLHFGLAIGTYRDMSYMINECMRLADQLADLESKVGLAKIAGKLFSHRESSVV